MSSCLFALSVDHFPASYDLCHFAKFAKHTPLGHARAERIPTHRLSFTRETPVLSLLLRHAWSYAPLQRYYTYG